MNCPRCGRDIPEHEKLCPYCHEIISSTIGVNNYKKDGFIQLKKNADGEDDEQLILKPKEDRVTYFKISEMNIFVVAIVFILIVAVITIFGLKALQSFSNDTPQEIFVPAYTTPTTEPVTEKVIENTVKDVSIKNLYGSWKSEKTQESEGHAIPYFSFGEAGAAQYNYGSLTIKGNYKDFSKDKKNLVYIEIEEKLSGLYSFDVTGNETDGYTLTLVNTETRTKITFVTDKDIVGVWKSEDKTKSYTFTKDGRLSRVISNQIMDGVWSCSDKGVLEVKYMEYSVRTIYLKYTIFEDKLIVNNTIYYKEKD